MEDIDKNGDGFIDLEEYIGEWNTVLCMIFETVSQFYLKSFMCCYSLHSLKSVEFVWISGDMYNHEDEMDEPEWVSREREQFSEFRDKNKDGKMDKEETMDWILPADYDHAEAEAKHLVYESDTNKVSRP